MLVPGRPVPPLEATLTTGAPFRLHAELERSPFVIVEIYRGTHCGICASYLRNLDARHDELLAHGAAATAVSMNDRDTALEAARTFGLTRLELAYGLDLETAHAFGLYLSNAIKPSEPRVFAEPATFVVSSDGTLYAADVRSSPHLRPELDRLVNLVRRASEGYPPRGGAIR
jgi:peroxiredoxin